MTGTTRSTRIDLGDRGGRHGLDGGGSVLRNCSCDVPCPCTVSLDLGADRDRCNAFLVFEVESGEVDGVDVSGVTVAAMVDSPKVMSERN